MPRQQYQRDMLNDEGRAAAINRRLEAFDEEAAAAEDPPELIQRLRAELEEELTKSASPLPRQGTPVSDYQRLRGGYLIRQADKESKGPGIFEYPNSDMPKRVY